MTDRITDHAYTPCDDAVCRGTQPDAHCGALMDHENPDLVDVCGLPRGRHER